MESRKVVLMNILQDRNRDTGIEESSEHSGGRRGWDKLREQHRHYTLPCVDWIANGKLLCGTGSSASLALCDDLEGWNWGRRDSRGKGCMYIYIHICLWLIHVVVQWKPIQHCGEITLQFKKKEENVVHIYNEILLSHKKECTCVICRNID